MIKTHKIAALAAVCGLGALAVSPAAEGRGGGARQAKPRHVAPGKGVNGSCQFKLKQTAGSTLLQGTETGPATCSKPFGKGTATTTYKNVVTGPNLSSTGNAKLVLKRGTINSTTKLTGKVGQTTTLTGTAKLIGGTGAYKKAHGTLKLTCVTKDLGKNLDCTETGKTLGV